MFLAERKTPLAGVSPLASGRVLVVLVIGTVTGVSLWPMFRGAWKDVPVCRSVEADHCHLRFVSLLALRFVSRLLSLLSAYCVFCPLVVSASSSSSPLSRGAPSSRKAPLVFSTEISSRASNPASDLFGGPASDAQARGCLRRSIPEAVALRAKPASPLFSLFSRLEMALVDTLALVPSLAALASPSPPSPSPGRPGVSVPPRPLLKRSSSLVVLGLLVHLLSGSPGVAPVDVLRSFDRLFLAEAAQLLRDDVEAQSSTNRRKSAVADPDDWETQRREWRYPQARGPAETGSGVPPGDSFGAGAQRQRENGDPVHTHSLRAPFVLEGNEIPAPRSDHRFRRFVRLANGMEILILVDPLQLRSAPSHVSLSVAGGFLHDPAHLPGLATLSGHLIFNNYVPVSSALSAASLAGGVGSEQKSLGRRAESRNRRGEGGRDPEQEQGREEPSSDSEAGGMFPSLDAFLFAHDAAEPLHFSTGEFASALSYSLPTPALAASLAELKHILLHPNITDASVGVGVVQLLQQQQKQVQKRKSEPYWRKASILKNHVFNPAHKTSRFHVGSTDLIFLLLHHQQEAAARTAVEGSGRGAGSGREAKDPVFERVSLPMFQHVNVWLKNEDIPSLVWEWHKRFYVANAFKLVVSTPGSQRDLDRLTEQIQRLFDPLPSNPALEHAFTCKADAETPFFASAQEAEAFAHQELEASMRATAHSRRGNKRDRAEKSQRRGTGRASEGPEESAGVLEEGDRNRDSSGTFFQPSRVAQVACGPARERPSQGEGDRETRRGPGETAAGRNGSEERRAETSDSRCGSSAEATGQTSCAVADDSAKTKETDDGARKRDDPTEVPVARHCDLRKEILLEPATENEHSVDFVFVFEKPHPKWTVFDAKYVVDVLGSEGPGSLVAHLRKQGLAESIDVEAEESRCYSTLRASVELKDFNMNHTAIMLIGSSLFSYLRFIRESVLDRAFVESRMRMYRLAFDAHVPPLPPRPPLPGALGTIPALLPSSLLQSSLPSSSPGQAGTNFSPQEEVAYLAADLQEILSPARVFTEQWLLEDVGKQSLEHYLDQLTPDNLILMISSPLVVPLCTLVSSFFGIPFAINPLDATQDAAWSALVSLPPERALLLARRTGFSLPPASLFVPETPAHVDHHLGENAVDRFGQARGGGGRAADEPEAEAGGAETVEPNSRGPARSGADASSLSEEEERVLFSSRQVPRLLAFEDGEESTGLSCSGHCELFHLPYRTPEQNPPRASVTLLLNYAVPSLSALREDEQATQAETKMGGAKGRTGGEPPLRDTAISPTRYREAVVSLMGLYVATVKEMLHEVTVYASMAEIAFSIEADQYMSTVEIHVEGVSAVIPVLVELIVKGLMAGSPGSPVAGRAPPEGDAGRESPATAVPPLPQVFACRNPWKDACGDFLDLAAFERVKQEKIDELREGAHDLPSCLAEVVFTTLLRDRDWGGRHSKLDVIRHARLRDVEDAGALLKGKLFVQALVAGDMSETAAKRLMSNVSSRLQLSGKPAVEELSWEPVLSMKKMNFPSFVERQIRHRGGRALPAVPRYRWRLAYGSWVESNVCSPFSLSTSPSFELVDEDRLDARQRSESTGKASKEKTDQERGTPKTANGPAKEAPLTHPDGLHGPLLGTSALRIELGVLTDKQLAIAAVLELLLAYPMYRHVCALDGACHSLSFSLRQEPAGVSYFLLDLRTFEVPACVATERAEAWFFTQAGVFSGMFPARGDASHVSSWTLNSASPGSAESPASQADVALYPSDGETVLLRRDFLKKQYAHNPAIRSVPRKASEAREARGKPEQETSFQERPSGSCAGAACPEAVGRRASFGASEGETGDAGSAAVSPSGQDDSGEGEAGEREEREEREHAASCSESTHGADRLPRGGVSPDLSGSSCAASRESVDDGSRSGARGLASAFDPRQHRAFEEPGFFVFLDRDRFQKAKDAAEASFLMLYDWEADHVQRRRRREAERSASGREEDGNDAKRDAKRTENPETEEGEADTFLGRPFIPADIQMFVHEIRKRTYVFARREQVARHIRSVTLEDAREFFLNSVIVAPWLVVELSNLLVPSSSNNFDGFSEPHATSGVGGMMNSGPEACSSSDSFYAERGMPDMTTLDMRSSSNPLWRLRNSWVDVESINGFREATTNAYTLGIPELYRRQGRVSKQQSA
ncbi:hypothetical protein TGGT1_314850 [Toxoplasma gondii GT1]|uniref:Peptidase M16 middle/third domain-containing protein n=2 Tax=Toxoplasma gondii TaxID=5811 RepID=S7UMH3_TOXGG|nr:hypothetical protein TGGT1_314850 [Toxoplasma gondii GT1]KAF4639612.1 hypothetical protein TGRH88_053840 [Toxoplasma gondii]